MIVVIDGYNVAKQVYGQKDLGHRQRDAFVQKLCGYLEKQRLEGVIVFDGGQSDYPDSTRHGAVTVTFSGYKASADDIIKKFIDKHREHELLVVTSDHELRSFAHARGKQTIKAHEFYERFVAAPAAQNGQAKQTDLIKWSSDAPPDLDELMMQATEHLRPKEESEELARARPSYTMSKKDRKRSQLLSKLEKK